MYTLVEIDTDRKIADDQIQPHNQNVDQTQEQNIKQTLEDIHSNQQSRTGTFSKALISSLIIIECVIIGYTAAALSQNDRHAFSHFFTMTL